MRTSMNARFLVSLYSMLGVSLILSLPALAQQNAAGNPTAVSAPGEPGSNPPQAASTATRQGTDSQVSGQDFTFVRMFGGLILIVSLIIGAFYGGRKYFPHYFQKPSGDRRLKLIESLGMGDKRNVALLQVDNKIFLVGNTPNQITFLANLSDMLPLASAPELATVSPSLSLSPKSQGDSFRNLREVEKKHTDKGSAKVIPPDIRAKMRQLREALEH